MLNNYWNYFFICDRNRLTIKSLCWSTRGANCCCLPVASAQWPLLAKYEFLTVNPSPWSKPAPLVLALALSAWSISPTTCGGSVSTNLNTPPWRSSFSCLLVSLLHHLYHPNIFPSKSSLVVVVGYRHEWTQGIGERSQFAGIGAQSLAAIHSVTLSRRALQIWWTFTPDTRAGTHLPGKRGFFLFCFQIIIIFNTR
jgi:hypothetical protein